HGRGARPVPHSPPGPRAVRGGDTQRVSGSAADRPSRPSGPDPLQREPARAPFTGRARGQGAGRPGSLRPARFGVRARRPRTKAGPSQARLARALGAGAGPCGPGRRPPLWPLPRRRRALKLVAVTSDSPFAPVPEARLEIPSVSWGARARSLGRL